MKLKSNDAVVTGNLSPIANATVRPFAQEDGSVSIAGKGIFKGHEAIRQIRSEGSRGCSEGGR